jgi:predicted ATPase/class 3 adenylate cyclase
MNDLPTGTVTFLFTDLEGSTRLWEQHPPAMREAVARHDALLRQAIAGHAGTVFKTGGDAFFAVFHRATDAVAAALEGQLALAAEKWRTVHLRARMAVHTGDAEPREGDYFGPTLNRTARLLAAGHGGQTLLSLATATLVRDALPPEGALRDLGSHRLKDLQQPERVFELRHPGLHADFPPLRSLDALAHNLPLQATSFIGRDREIAELRRLIRERRLLTLTGPGGSGKTRLALQLAAEVVDDFRDGVWLVELESLSDPSLVPQAVASHLGVREDPARRLTETLTEVLKPRRLLILLDNCEHLLEASANLAAALARSCPEITILATSREPLGSPGERTWPVAPLPVPDLAHLTGGAAERVSELENYDAVRLFLDRVQLSKPEFTITSDNAAAVARICHRLDGIPLAIELAARRVKVLSPEEVASRLDDRFRLLTGGSRTAMPRHQTLRAAIDWSYSLLGGSERTLLRRLAVFAGEWSLPAAEGVGGGDGLPTDEVLDLHSQLVDKSLVMVAGELGGETRYRLLATIHQYAHDRLVEARETDATRDRHRDWFLKLGEQAEVALRGSEQAVWLDRLDREHDNFRAALEWTYEREGEGAEAGMRLVLALDHFWVVRGHLSEGRRWVERALAHSADLPAQLRVYALIGAVMFTMTQADFERSTALLEEGLALAREIGDVRSTMRLLNSLGVEAWNMGRKEEAAHRYAEALPIARELGEGRSAGDILSNLAVLATESGDYGRARAIYADALESYGETLYSGRVNALLGIGLSAFAKGEYAEAATFLREGLQAAVTLGARLSIMLGLESMAGVHAVQGDPTRAARLLGAADALRKAIAAPIGGGEKTDHDMLVAAARAALDEAAFNAAWNEGAILTPEQAIELALAGGPLPSTDDRSESSGRVVDTL